MENLTELIGSLNNHEINMVRKFYALNRKPDELKRHKLLEDILLNKNTSPVKLINISTKKPKDAAFLILQKRLFDDILKVLLISQGSQNFVSKFIEAKYKCKRMLVEVDVLFNKGLENIAIDRLKQAERLAKKYQLTTEKIIINQYKQDTSGVRKGLQAYSKASEEILLNFNTFKDESAAVDYFRKISMANVLYTNKELNYVHQARDATKELKTLSEKNSSVHIRYYYLRSAIFYCHLANDYPSAELYAFEFLDLIKNNHVIYSSDGMGGAYMMLSNINIYLGDSEKIINYALEGSPYFFEGSINQASLGENLFLGYLMSKNYLLAAEVCEKISAFSNIKKNPFRKSKWVYYRANIFFMQGQYSEALALLQKQSELTADKSGWRLGYKILEMMCIIELGNYDWLDYRIETFRKLLSAVKKENIHRPKIILQIIKQFIKSAYNFKTVSSKTDDLYKTLKEGAGEYKHDPKGYEVIRFDQWWEDKLKSKVKSF